MLTTRLHNIITTSGAHGLASALTRTTTTIAGPLVLVEAAIRGLLVYLTISALVVRDDLRKVGWALRARFIGFRALAGLVRIRSQEFAQEHKAAIREHHETLVDVMKVTF